MKFLHVLCTYIRLVDHLRCGGDRSLPIFATICDHAYRIERRVIGRFRIRAECRIIRMGFSFRRADTTSTTARHVHREFVAFISIASSDASHSAAQYFDHPFTRKEIANFCWEGNFVTYFLVKSLGNKCKRKLAAKLAAGRKRCRS